MKKINRNGVSQTYGKGFNIKEKKGRRRL